MRNPAIALIGAVAGIVTIAFQATSVTGQKQSPSTATQAKSSTIPRLPDGHPDLQGTYDIATLTPLERQAGAPAVLSAAQAKALEKRVAERNAQADSPSRANREAPPVGGDGSTGPAGNVGGYNNFWLDSGTQLITVNGEKRTSIIIDPPDGRVPPVTPEARQRIASRAVRTTSDAQAQENDPGFEGNGAYDDPERRPLGERCLLGFGSTSGPPALPVLYNNLHQIVQTHDFVMILNEMDHDARVIRIGGDHAPSSVRKWMGDSIGHWEGDTLVVDTTNFTDKTRFRGSTPNLHVVERFTRVDARTILYRFTIEDSATWGKPWTGEYPWPATADNLYEYACHEANYALGDILRGARLKEAEESGKKK
jgi:hypothetical protein